MRANLELFICWSVCRSVCLSCVLWQNSWFDLDTVWVVSGVGREMGVLDRCIRWGWRLPKGMGQFCGKFGASHCNHWWLCGILSLCCEGWWLFSSRITLGFLNYYLSCRSRLWWCHVFHSRVFHLCIFDGAAFSTPAFSVAPLCYLHFAPENPEDGEMYLLVPAHPCCPKQSPESCKMAMCVFHKVV